MMYYVKQGPVPKINLFEFFLTVRYCPLYNDVIELLQNLKGSRQYCRDPPTCLIAGSASRHETWYRYKCKFMGSTDGWLQTAHDTVCSPLCLFISLSLIHGLCVAVMQCYIVVVLYRFFSQCYRSDNPHTCIPTWQIPSSSQVSKWILQQKLFF